MALKAGLDKSYLYCYYEPTLQAHTTVSSMVTRLKTRENGQVSFDEGAQHENADVALIGAHEVIICVLNVVNSHFQARFADFSYVWET
jgi:hypothetical protein